MSDQLNRESNASPIESWHLTAYALGELDEESQKKVEAWLAQHPEDRDEVDAIRQTATSIERELAQLPQSVQLDSTRATKIQEAIASASAISDASTANADLNLSISKRIRQRRLLFALTSGLAAGLAATTFWLGRPGSKDWIAFNSKTRNSVVIESERTTLGSDLKNQHPEPASSQADPRQQGEISGWDKSLADAERFGTAEAGKSLTPSLTPSISSGSVQEELVREERYLQGQRESGMGGSGLPSGGMPGGGMPGGGLPGGSGGQNQLGFVPPPAPQVPGFSAPGGGGGGRGGLSAASGFGLEARDRLGVTENYYVVPSRGNEVDGFIRDSEAKLSLAKDQAKSLGDFPEELKQNVPSKQRLEKGLEQASGDRFDSIPETPFAAVDKEPLSTFSIDVDTASYSKLRQYVMENHVVPPPATIRIEEWLNYFDYQYPGPSGDQPFAAHMKMGDCPWNAKHKLVRVAVQAKKVDNQQRPKSNLVFLIDVSGSMGDANKLPLVKRTLGLLTSQLREEDRVAIVVYAGASGCVLPSTSGAQKDQILASINELQSGGSTNGGQGIELAYKIAKENFVPGGVNRVLLCTDGDFNVGVTSTDALVAMMQEQAKSNIFFTCLGYGIGNYNDSMMEKISNKGNGTYAMVDSETEARRVMTDQLSGTLMTVAKDVKIQIEFNPANVHSYRLIGYENRRLAAADFNNDKKDAGEIGAGHRVTALYEIVPVGQEEGIPGAIDELRFSKSQKADTKATADSSEPSKDWLLLKIRSKQPESSQSTKQEFVLGEIQAPAAYEGEQSDFDWAVSVAEFGLLMRKSQLAPELSWEKMLARAMDSTASDPYRRECVTIMQRAKELSDR